MDIDALSTIHHHFMNNWNHVEPFDRITVEALAQFVEAAPFNALRNLDQVWNSYSTIGNLKASHKKYIDYYKSFSTLLDEILSRLNGTGLRRHLLQGLKERADKIVQLLS